MPERGFTLIENMVALAIFSVGMMAIVFMLLNGIALSRTGQSLTRVNLAMEEILGMIRSDGADAIQYNNVNTALTATVPTGAGPVATNIATWIQSLKNLPGAGLVTGGSGSITMTSVAGGVSCPCVAQVTIQWGIHKSYTVTTDVDY